MILSNGLRVLLLGSVFLQSGCSISESSFWPSLSSEDPLNRSAENTRDSSPSAITNTSSNVVPVTAQNERDSKLIQNKQPAVGTGTFEPSGVTLAEPTGTFVGQKVVELRSELKQIQTEVFKHNDELQKMRLDLVNNSQRFHGTIAAVNARLQVGTTPGNPILVQQFKSAQADLDRLTKDIATINQLAGRIGNTSTMSSFLSESAQAAFSVSGAIDEDHRQLAILEDEVNRTDVLIDRLLTEVINDVRRQTNYVSTERSNLNLVSAGIKTGEIYGGSLINIAMANAGGIGNLGISAGSPIDTAGRRPLVIIRFDRDKVPYERALYNAVSRVLEKNASAVFDLVAVAPNLGGKARIALNSNKARRHSGNVLRTLVEMGLPSTRVAISAKISNDARSNEVHLYLR
jgi:hypothetical protein